MLIIPMSPLIHTIPAADRAFGTAEAPAGAAENERTQPGTFLDALRSVWDQAAEAQAAKSEDMVNIMLGDTQSIEKLQTNIAKAELATELLVTVKNAAVDAYNEIMRMSV